jgi:cytochrome c-type biogenesis protein CcmH
MENSISNLKRQLQQLRELLDTGVLPQEQYETSKKALEQRVLDLVLQGAPVEEMASTPPPGRTSGKFVLALGAAVVVIAAAGYAWKGTPSQVAVNPVPLPSGASPDGANGAPHATNFDQIAAMADKLAARMQTQPDDAEGWAMLARSYSVLGRHPEALTAYEKAVALRKDDATLLADYADSLAVKNDRKLDGAPMKQVERALKIDPRNLKALSLAGTHAFDRKDFAGAVKYWEQVIQAGPADNGIVQQTQTSLAEAKELAGGAVGAKAPVVSGKVSSAVAGAVSGTVTISPALRKNAQPDDTVFIFARATEGSRMPLAIVRKQVKDLPIAFQLDDSMGMSGTDKLSGAGKVIVGARISKSGNAMPQVGDLSGQTGPISVGASGLTLEISTTVAP